MRWGWTKNCSPKASPTDRPSNEAIARSNGSDGMLLIPLPRLRQAEPPQQAREPPLARSVVVLLIVRRVGGAEQAAGRGAAGPMGGAKQQVAICLRGAQQE